MTDHEMRVKGRPPDTPLAGSPPRPQNLTKHADATIAYVLMEFPRLSESFIINELVRLEQLGVKLYLFSIKHPKEDKVHGSVSRLTAPIRYLPPVTSLSASPFWRWLKANLPRYFPVHFRVFRQRPWPYLRTLLEAVELAWRARSSTFGKPKFVFIKEFLQAGFIAQEVIGRQNVTHLHAHFCHGSTTVAMFTGRIAGLPFSFTAHAKDVYLKSLNPAGLLHRKIRRAKFLITCTDANRRYLQQVCPDGAPIHTVYHGLDPGRFTPHPRSTASPPLILSVGRFVEKKGFAILIEACRILRDRGHEFRCRIVGDPGDEVTGDETPRIRRLIQELDLHHQVVLSPGVTQEALQEIYREATIFALPCQVLENGDRDGIPNVLAEAMATGLPVVSTAISGIPELITHGQNGVLVPQRDPQALALGLEELLMNPALGRSLGRSARKTICGMFDSSVTTQALKRLFETPDSQPTHRLDPLREPVHVE